MFVILELSVPSDATQIGRILPLSGDDLIRLETIVPIGGEVVPFVRVRHVDPDTFEAPVRDDPRVETVEWFSGDGEDHLFAFDWRLDDEILFDAIDAAGGYVMEGEGGTNNLEFRLRFPNQAAVSTFEDTIAETSIPVELTAVYYENLPPVDPRFGLTHPQREALVAAVEAGYFDVPREVTTAALAEEFGISDQAFIERLRRAVSNLSEHTITADTDE